MSQIATAPTPANNLTRDDWRDPKIFGPLEATISMYALEGRKKRNRRSATTSLSRRVMASFENNVRQFAARTLSTKAMETEDIEWSATNRPRADEDGHPSIEPA